MAQKRIPKLKTSRGAGAFLCLLAGSLIAGCGKSTSSRLYVGNSQGVTELPTLVVTPGFGPMKGGTKLSIRGALFNDKTIVQIGTVDCLDPTLISPTELTCYTSATPMPGTFDVKASSDDPNIRYVATAGFSFLEALAITAINPSDVPVMRRETLTIEGKGFAPGAVVTVHGEVCGGVSVTIPSTIRCQLPVIGRPGPTGISIKGYDGQTIISQQQLNFKGIPTITDINPKAGPMTRGTTLRIAGSGFDAGSSVQVGGAPCTDVRLISPTGLTCSAPEPSGPGTVSVSVTDAFGQSGTLRNAFEYRPAPRITRMMPSTVSTLGGTSVTISGESFTNGSSVSFGGKACRSQDLVNSSTIICVAPDGPPGLVGVSVRNDDGQTSPVENLTYVAPAPSASASGLTLSRVTPNRSLVNGGGVLSLVGTGFTPQMTVKIGTFACQNLITSSSSAATCTIPQGSAGLQNVSVDVSGAVVTLGGSFLYLLGPAPQITAITPNRGPREGGTSVTILGSGLTSGIKVAIDDRDCINVVVSAGGTSLTCSTPEGSFGAKDVVVTALDTQSARLSQGYSYVSGPAPTLISISPDYGPPEGGSTVTITGSNFVTGTKVFLDGLACTSITLVTSTTITCQTPPRSYALGRSVNVTNPDGQSAALANGYSWSLGPPPVITSISPTFGPPEGGTALTLSGTNFSSSGTPPSVTIDGKVCTNVRNVTSSSLMCDTPANAFALNKPIKLINPDGQTATFSAGYSWSNGSPPTVSSVVPNFGPPAGGTTLELVGTNFKADSRVLINGLPCLNIRSVTDTRLLCDSPAHPYAFNKNVELINPDGQTGLLPQAFSWSNGLAPTITFVSPSFGPPEGGTTITIAGSNFHSGAKVQINGLFCANVVLVSSSSLTCSTPASSYALGVSVIVTNPDGQSATLSGGYSWSNGPAPTVTSITPNFGPAAGGTAVTISGSNFVSQGSGPTQVNPIVTIDGLVCQNVRNLSTSSLVCDTPASSYKLNKPVVITNPDGQIGSLQNAFSWSNGLAPTVSSVTPNFGPTTGGTTIKITGSNFFTGLSVFVGGTACSSVNFVNSGEVQCVTPPGPSGSTQTVTVTNPDSQQGSLPSAFAWSNGNPPSIASVFPNTGSITGGSVTYFKGGNFAAGAVASLGGINCTDTTVVSATLIRCVVPTGTVGSTASARVTNPDGQYATLTQAFTYQSYPTFVFTSIGSTDNERFGSALSYIPDLSGDGIKEFAISAPNKSVSGQSGAGIVQVYNGSTGALICQLISPTPIPNGNFGSSVAGGLVDADGLGDVIIGEPGQTAGPHEKAGMAYVFSGSAIQSCTSQISAPLFTLQSPSPSAQAQFGLSVASGKIMTSLNDDIVVGEPYAAGGGTQRGAVRVFAASTGLIQYSMTSPGSSDLEHFGFSVASADINGDSRADIIIGAPGAANGGVARGLVYAISGADGTTPVFSTPAGGSTTDYAKFGFSVGVAGLINLDNRQDIVVGEPYYNSGMGRAYVIGYSGGASSTVIRRIDPQASEAFSFFGMSVSGVQDFNGDGTADLVVGQPYLTNSGPMNRGRLAVYSGLAASMGLSVVLLTIDGKEENALLGRAVAGAGDIDANGLGDLLFGEPLSQAGGLSRGRAYVHRAP